MKKLRDREKRREEAEPQDEKPARNQETKRWRVPFFFFFFFLSFGRRRWPNTLDLL